MGTRMLLFTSVICLLFCASCSTTRKVAYFQNAQDTTYRQKLGITEAPFQQGDILDIVVSSLSKEASADFNRTVATDGKGSGYLINTDGEIEMPKLGKVKAAGFTKKQLKDNIVKLLLAKNELVEPQVEIRYLNFEVTVLGEVAHPTVINVPSEQISLVRRWAWRVILPFTVKEKIFYW